MILKCSQKNDGVDDLENWEFNIIVRLNLGFSCDIVEVQKIAVFI